MASSNTLKSRATIIAVLAALAFSGSAVLSGPARAQVSLDIVIRTPPPPVRVEVAPPPRVGYVWAPGYWSWDGHRHI
jgi:YXWGXW repeat-containing protein